MRAGGRPDCPLLATSGGSGRVAGRTALPLKADCGCPLGRVRLTGREMADRKRSRLSRGELTPFSERGNAVLFEDIAWALSD